MIVSIDLFLHSDFALLFGDPRLSFDTKTEKEVFNTAEQYASHYIRNDKK